jgi:asparagine synthetase B (glutamine-hydrolysing)
MSFIFRQSSAKKQRVYLSGQGGDEIYSDYGYNGKKFYKHSQFGGKFPKDLAQIFPWRSFYGGTQLSYLSKEENVSGLHGIEGRYPLLDKYVVQEFLWLVPDLKNKYYKGPIHAYMEQNHYPFDENVKIGFEADVNLQ